MTRVDVLTHRENPNGCQQIVGRRGGTCGVKDARWYRMTPPAPCACQHCNEPNARPHSIHVGGPHDPHRQDSLHAFRCDGHVPSVSGPSGQWKIEAVS